MNIKDFFITSKDDISQVYIKKEGEGCHVIQYEALQGIQQGVLWNVQSNPIHIKTAVGSIVSCPSFDLNYVIVIYLPDYENGEFKFSSYPFPNNTVIYNFDGTVHKILRVPPLISDAAKKRGWYKRQPDAGIGFFQVKWQKDNNGNMVVAVEIKEIGWGPFREVRVLEPKTGEFRECLYGAIEYK